MNKLVGWITMGVLILQGSLVTQRKVEDGLNLFLAATHYLSFFSVQVAFLAGLFCILSSKADQRRIAQKLESIGLTSYSVMCYVVVAGIVYYTLLFPNNKYPFSAETLLAHFTHGFLPVYFSIQVRHREMLTYSGSMSLATSLRTLIFPFFYLSGAMIRGNALGVYPYFFLDPNRIGWNGLVGVSVGLSILLVAMDISIKRVLIRKP